MVFLALAVSLVAMQAASAQDQTLEDRLRNLEETLKKQDETIKEQQKLIKELKAEMGLKKPAEKQVVAQPKEVPVAGVKPSVPLAEKAQAAPAPAPESTQTAALQEEVNELKEQVGQVAEAQKQEFLSKYNPAIGFVGELLFNYRITRPSSPTSPSRGPISDKKVSMFSNVLWN